MIEYLVVATPKQILDRSMLDPKALENFERVTGIKKTRRYEGSTIRMIKDALNACDFSGDGLSGVIVVTQSPDRLSPCLAVDIHNHLHLSENAFAFDMNRACSGYIDGLYVASKMPRKTLLICADRLRYSPTPLEGLIFSDSVSITVVNQKDNVETLFFNDGSKSGKLYCGLNNEMHMDGSFIFDFVTSKVAELIKDFQRAHPCDFLVPHQANLSMLRILTMRSGFKTNWLSSIEEYGNQSFNSIPTAIIVNEGKALNKDLLLVGFGAGVSASCMKLRWPGSQEIGMMVEI